MSDQPDERDAVAGRQADAFLDEGAGSSESQSTYSGPEEVGQSLKTYSLSEVVALVLPELSHGERWLAERLRRGEIRGYKIGRTWRMTHGDVEDLIARHRNSPRPTLLPAEPERYPGGLTRRSWLYRQRYGLEGNPNLRGPRRTAPPAEPPPAVKPVPSDFRYVIPEPKETIEAMPPLTETQQQLLQRVEREGAVAVTGRFRKTVEGLVRRGLVKYEVAHVLSESEKAPGYIYRFTVQRMTDN
ncbi:helix-turn-helix domain-containing protein [Mycolicibacter virginiensis]|nr:helix-turn-helix domain-containing protein [Mycolicibacter virginiensis]ULP47329.1 helix-turn-helix domain-containing protein [Mycolicibacter virginiensis]